MYYNLLIRYHEHHNSYIDICRCYRSIYEVRKPGQLTLPRQLQLDRLEITLRVTPFVNGLRPTQGLCRVG